MAEEQTTVTAPVTPTPVAAPAAAPATAPAPASIAAAPTAPAAAVAPTTSVQPTPASAPETPPTASVEAQAPAPAQVADTASAKAETVMGEALDAKPAETPKPTEPVTAPVAEAPKVEEQKATEGQSEEPAPPPTYDPFTLPEGVSLDQERVNKFNEILGELERSGKADHAAVQQFGQKAVEFHIEEVKKAVTDVTSLYQQTWERQKTEWKDSFLKDPEIGGNRFQTTVDAARNFIRTHGGTPEQQQEFRNVMESSGLGNHPAVIRLLANAGAAMKEGVPLATVKPVSPPKSKTATLYGKSQ